MKQIKRVGILTAGGDCPGLNAAIRGVGKALLGRGIEAVGIRDGFLGLIENRTLPLDSHALAGILTVGGTILGTSRVKPHRLEIKGRIRDVRDQILANCSKNRFDAVVCIGGDGTQKNAIRLAEKGLPVITLPKTIDNDVAMTDASFGFDTALGVATAAIDRLHSTAHSHHRIIVVELMGHRAGWLSSRGRDRRRRRRHPDPGDTLQREASGQGDSRPERSGHEFQHRCHCRGRAVAPVRCPIPRGESAQSPGEDAAYARAATR